MKGMPVVGVLAAGVVAVTLGSQLPQSADDSHIAIERVRLRAHFDSVLDELRARDVSQLSMEQRAARSELIDWVAHYRDAGRFPLNDRYADTPTPIFRDARGVTCAMAYVIARSGRRDIVDRVARENNMAYVDVLDADPEFAAWLDSTGLATEEAARIQPAYPPRADELVDRSYARTAQWLNGLSIATTTWNLARPGIPIGLLGVLAGTATLLHGVDTDQQLDHAQRRDSDIDKISRVTGASAIVVGLWTIFRRPKSTEAASREWQRGLAPMVEIPFGTAQFTVGFAAWF